MNKVKKIVITASAVTLLASGVTYSLCKDKSRELELKLENYQAGNDDVLICAHRGFSSKEVENTAKSITLANEKEYIDYIEFDIRMTKDGKIVLTHDNVLKDVVLDYVNVSNTDEDEIFNNSFLYQKKFNKNYFWLDDELLLINNRNKELNNKKYQIIGLKEAISLCQDKKMIVELKFNNDIVEFVSELKKELKGIDTTNIIFQSFNVDGMRYLKENSNYECQLLISDESNLAYTSEFDRVGLQISLVNYELIKKLIDDNKKVAIWTINTTYELNSVLDNVKEYYSDIIYITDYPDLIITRLNEKKLIKKVI